MIMIELEALNWSFQLLLYIRHDFGHVKSRRQTSFSSCIQILLFWESSLIHNAEFAVDLSPVPNAHSPFLVASKVARYRAFRSAVSLGSTLL